MTRYVALLRGINVGRAKRIAMADLRALLEALGYEAPRTLLNSGNAVFGGGAEKPAVHAARIRAAVLEQLGVDAPVLVKSARDIAAVIAGNPLAAIADDPSRLLVAFTADAKTLAGIDLLQPLAVAPEVLHVGPQAAYLWCANGILESRVGAALLGQLGPAGTTRNWATVEKIHAMMQA